MVDSAFHANDTETEQLPCVGRRLAELKQEMTKCCNELAALRACLEDTGLLQHDKFLATLHRNSFAAALVKHPFVTSASLETSLCAEELTRLISEYAGLASAAGLTAVSTKIQQGSRSVIAALKGKCQAWIYVCGGTPDGHISLDSAACLHPQSDSWEALPKMVVHRRNASTGVIGSRIYICGGHTDDGAALRDAECFDAQCGLWEAVPLMQMARAAASAGVIEGRLYLCGGYDEHHQNLSSAERFDPEAQSGVGAWEVVAPMSERRAWTTAGTIGGQLFVCGGEADEEWFLSSVECFCPRIASWQAVEPMLEPRSAAAAVSFGSRLFVCGGLDCEGQDLNTVERYDPRADCWEQMVPMASARSGCAAAAVLGRIYVFGGWGEDEEVNAVEQFDAVAGTWTPMPPMTEGRSYACAASISRLC